MGLPAVPLPPAAQTPEEEPRILLRGVPWAAYVVLRDAIEGAGVRMTYLEGALELMSPSRSHEVEKTQVARLLELFCLERDIPLFGYGSTTFRREEKQRGLEPDECYSRGQDKDTPDIALEVIKTHGLLDKLEVYRGLGVREVWIFEDGAFQLHALRGDRYEALESRSEVFPEVDLGSLAEYATWADQHEALRAFRAALREG